MSNIISTGNMQDFVHFMANRHKRDMNTAPRPSIIKLNGNTGRYSMSVWNKDEKKFDEKELGVELMGTVLDTCYFVKSKYEKDARQYWKTREVTSMDDRIELLMIDLDAKDAKDRAKTVGTFQSYQDFKKQNTTIHPVTKKETYGFDFFVSLYVYLHEMDQVVNMQMKGSSRGAWFDYSKSYDAGTDVEDMVQIKILFASQEETSQLQDKDGNAKTFFHMTFKTLGLNSEGELMKVASMAQALFQWKTAWNEQNQQEHLEPIKAQPVPDHQMNPELAEKIAEQDDIRLEDIPF